VAFLLLLYPSSLFFFSFLSLFLSFILIFPFIYNIRERRDRTPIVTWISSGETTLRQQTLPSTTPPSQVSSQHSFPLSSSLPYTSSSS
jgi:hypothetical protein